MAATMARWAFSSPGPEPSMINGGYQKAFGGPPQYNALPGAYGQM